jgi:hypothetical protein
VSLVGFSMGARVLFMCCHELAGRGDAAHGILQDGMGHCWPALLHCSCNAVRVVLCALLSLLLAVVLLGCPVSASPQPWLRIRHIVSGRLINGYSSTDYMLRFVYRTKTFDWHVAGVGPIGVTDVSELESQLVSKVLHTDAGDVSSGNSTPLDPGVVAETLPWSRAGSTCAASTPPPCASPAAAPGPVPPALAIPAVPAAVASVAPTALPARERRASFGNSIYDDFTAESPVVLQHTAAAAAAAPVVSAPSAPPPPSHGPLPPLPHPTGQLAAHHALLRASGSSNPYSMSPHGSTPKSLLRPPVLPVAPTAASQSRVAPPLSHTLPHAGADKASLDARSSAGCSAAASVPIAGGVGASSSSDSAAAADAWDASWLEGQEIRTPYGDGVVTARRPCAGGAPSAWAVVRLSWGTAHIHVPDVTAAASLVWNTATLPSSRGFASVLSALASQPPSIRTGPQPAVERARRRSLGEVANADVLVLSRPYKHIENVDLTNVVMCAALHCRSSASSDTCGVPVACHGRCLATWTTARTWHTS